MEKIILTGVGSAYITQPLYGLPTARVDEFLANGLGAQYMTKLNKLIVVSMGTGTSFVRVITQPLYGLPTARVDEFLANGLGAQYMTKLNKLIVVSMGTGTSFVKVDGNNVRHIGGIGIGGGTILGLSRLMLKTQEWTETTCAISAASVSEEERFSACPV